MQASSQESTRPHRAAPAAEALDLRETGAAIDGVPQVSQRRLFLQLQVFDGCADAEELIAPLEASALETVLYRDVNHPGGVGVLFIAEDPGELVDEVGRLVSGGPFATLQRRRELALTGRTYSTGHEPDLEDWLLVAPRQRALNPDLPWAVWYPLRRKPAFYRLAEKDRGMMLREHGMIGRKYGQAGYAQDIRLACFGLDEHDNDFVIGLLGADLFPLSKLVQEMRSTQQTGEYMESLGPFFVGKVCWQSRLK